MLGLGLVAELQFVADEVGVQLLQQQLHQGRGVVHDELVTRLLDRAGQDVAHLLQSLLDGLLSVYIMLVIVITGALLTQI